MIRHAGEQTPQLIGNEVMVFGTDEGISIISLFGRDRNVVFGALLSMRAYINPKGDVIFAKSQFPVRFSADSPPALGTPFIYETERFEEIGAWDKCEILPTKQLVCDAKSVLPVWREV